MAEQTAPDGAVLSANGGARGARRWPARKSPLVWAGVVPPLALLGIEVILVRRLVSMSVGLPAFMVALMSVLGAVLMVALAARLLSCLTLHYVLDDRALTIVWGTACWVVPLAAIGDVTVGHGPAVLVDGVPVLGCRVGRGYIKDGGRALFFTTAPPAATLALRAADCTYLVSPAGSDFLSALKERRQTASPAQPKQPGPGLLAALRHPLGAIAAGLSVLADVLLYAYLCWWYPVLPERLPVRHTAAGLADGWGPRSSLFWLPAMGSVVVLTNLALVALPPLRRRPAASFALLATGCLVQVFPWLAFLRILP